MVKPYLDNLLFKLAALLQQGSKMVMEQALTAVAAVADCVEEEFSKYYDTFVPFLISGASYRCHISNSLLLLCFETTIVVVLCHYFVIAVFIITLPGCIF